MKRTSLVHLAFGLRSVDEIAWARTGIAAVIVNAVSGMVFVAVPVTPMSLESIATPALGALLIILFGPLIGFFCSSIYARLEWFVGTRLGGKASLDDLYGIFAWSFLPLSVALLLCTLLFSFLDALKVPLETVTMIAASIPSLVIGYCSLRNYCSNVIAVQQYTRLRGAISLVLTFALFLMVIMVAGGFLLLILRYGMSENLKALLPRP